MEVSPLSREGEPSIQPITSRRLLAPSSCTRSVVSALYSGTFLVSRNATGLPRSASIPRWGRLRLFAGDRCDCDRRVKSSCTDHVPFGPSLSAPLAC